MSTTEVATATTTALIGYADKKRNRFGLDWTRQYTDAIPVEDVRDKMFNWEALEGAVFSVHTDENGAHDVYPDPTRMSVLHPVTRGTLGIHGKASYRIHQFPDWLLDTVVPILGRLGIGLVAVHHSGAVAAVMVEMSEDVVTPEGVHYRPYILLATSHDASIATSYTRNITVYGHPMAANLAKSTVGPARYSLRHTSGSLSRLGNAEEAVKAIEDMEADFNDSITYLVLTSLSEGQRDDFLERLYPAPEEEGRKRTIAIDRRADIRRLLREDDRIMPWANTAWGLLLAVNFANHELGIVHGDRNERNIHRLIYSKFASEDAKALKILQTVL